MPKDFSLTVITHSPLIAAALSDYPHFELIVLGGKLHRASGTCIGAQALEQLSYLNIDLCFPGGCALDADSGLTVTGFEEAAFKRALIRQSSLTVAGVTGDKLSRIAPYRVAACEELDHVVLTLKVPQSARDLLTAGVYPHYGVNTLLPDNTLFRVCIFSYANDCLLHRSEGEYCPSGDTPIINPVWRVQDAKTC